MRALKHRLTISVDRSLVDAGRRAVKAGLADSLSGWVSLAMADRAATERRLEAMGEAIAAYEEEFGPISDAELAAQARADRRKAVSVRGLPRPGQRRRRG